MSLFKDLPPTFNTYGEGTSGSVTTRQWSSSKGYSWPSHSPKLQGTLVQPSQLSQRQLNFRDSEAFQSRARKIAKEIIQAHIL